MHTYPASSTAGLNTSNLTTIYFTVRQDDLLKMPEHSGSMLRGAFGVALRSLTCITDLPECKDCPLKQHCKFPRLFEVPALQLSGVQAVNPYVIHVPITGQVSDNASSTVAYEHTHRIAQKTKTPKTSDKKTATFKKDDIWQFGMTVMGAAVAETTLIVQAWKMALATGLGARAPYSRATLLQARCDGKTLYLQAQPIPTQKRAPIEGVALHPDRLFDSTSLDSQIASADDTIQLTMHFLTPFRYQQNNRIVSHPDSLDSATFIASLYNRIRLCQDNHSPNELWDIGYDSYHRFKEDIETLSIVVDIAPNHVPRRSNRQQRKMQLYGLQGNLHLTGDQQTLTRLLPALQLGEQLHIGKNTTMGLGQYRLKLTPLPLT
ncbi:CRISPR system precrRNA processing endoribonuclease RAMP protein Cas6 [Psychrobacter sp. Ps2]|uniref:CRISPR system precrRNA processing endoribonuclease RAMP protein Cas6 n=1 Tax=Psychrobacter sp. Ps2 TaxID=2790956 RepID=UPI001EE11FE3|nr:CRISPR system precrRNA processing endoribonuclease RAMP protein Cas6 [Psychrobacter sp. Ps2]MCG3858827.1 CRISPR system precrRNA processing endoribonuclease RAMP protein Cas6 [Psychrobacter sp. Ps2]